MKISKRLFKWLKALIIIYCLFGIALYYLQEKFILHPVSLDTGYSFHFDQPFEEFMLPVNTTDTISLIKFKSATSGKRGSVIYFHGNTQNVEHYASFAKSFTKAGYDVWMPDYPGFGKSRGGINEKKLYQLADQVYKFVSSKSPKDSIVIYGKSFGTGIASYLAGYADCKMLILESPYYSMPKLLNSYTFIYPVKAMSKYNLPVWKYLDETREPVIIFHGQKDGITFFSDAIMLKEHLKVNDRFISIAKGSHNDLANYDVYKKTLDSLLTN